MGSCKGKLLSSFQNLHLQLYRGVTSPCCSPAFTSTLHFGMKYSVFCLKLHPNNIILQKVSVIFFNSLHGKRRYDLGDMDNAVDYILFISISYQ